MARAKSTSKRPSIGTLGAVASILAIPLAILLWYANRSPETPKPAPSGDTVTQGDNATAYHGRDIITGNDNINLNDNKGVVVIQQEKPKPDFIADHDGAGALLMKEPDFRAFIAASMSGQGEKVVGRLVNGTALAKLDQKPANPQEPSPPWAKVKVLDGDHKDAEGWILMNSLRKL
ncbi:MAG: hypothetical protein JW818_13970 [Pirellulales bacterium]|nr:hypothetical protein [Pirellulales bacterium]